MKVIYSPTVRVVSSTNVIGTAHRFVVPGDSGRPVAEAIEQRHGAALEHSFYTLHVDGISRAISHEIRIHRYLHFVQEPTRFITADSIRVVAPFDSVDADILGSWYQMVIKAVENWESFYEKLRKDGIGETQARSIACSLLPQCTATSMLISGTARAWAKFLAQRGNARAVPEMRQLSIAIATDLKRLSPDTFGNVVFINDTIEVQGGAL